MAARKRRPRCIVIAGPNGAGKTTFARQYLPGIARVVHFVNADLIAGGLSPLKPPKDLPTHGGKLGGVRQFRGVAEATEEEKMKIRTRPKRPESFAAGVGRGLRQAAKAARKTARMHGTPIYIIENGKVVARRP